jgi:hypothetical protein
MTPSQRYALFVRNAKACENAKHPKCTCVCGGKYHGTSHAAVLGELWETYREREEKDSGQQRLPEIAQP